MIKVTVLSVSDGRQRVNDAAAIRHSRWRIAKV